MVVLNLGRSWALSSKSNIRSQILDDMVRKDISCASLFQKNTLVVILLDAVAHWVLLIYHLFSDMLLEDHGCVNDIIEGWESIVSWSHGVLEQLSIKTSVVFEIKVAHLGVEIGQLLTADVSAGAVRKLYSCLSVGFDDVGFYLRPALNTLANDSIVSWGLDVIFLDCGLARCVGVVAEDKNSIIRTLLNGILKNDRVIVDDFNSTVIYLHLIHSNKSINSGIDNNGRAFANHKHIVENNWMWPFTLDVETRLPTGDHGIVSEDEYISLS